MTQCRLGTRGSALAMTQSGMVARALEDAAATAGVDLNVELVQIRTRGDSDPTALARLGGVGVFATALRQAMLNGEVDLAVHSFKDLPTAPSPGLRVWAVPEREDPRDALCSVSGASLANLPIAARVGTGSPRRAAQILRQRPDLEIVEIRGNVPTRLSRVHGSVVGADGPMGVVREPDLDAVILAAAGLRRLGLDSYVSELLTPTWQEDAAHAGDALTSQGFNMGTASGERGDQAEATASSHQGRMLPAAAQGALAVEAREDLASRLPQLAVVLEALDDPATRACATAERSLMRGLEAGCAAPVGALARPGTQGTIELEAAVFSLDGSALCRQNMRAEASAASRLGQSLAQELLAAGAAEVTNLRATKH